MAYQSGEEPIGSGTTTVTVTFAPAFSATPDIVLAIVQNPVDNPALSIQATLTAKSSTDFTVDLDATTDSANYELAWIAGDASLVFQAVTKLGTRVTDLPLGARELRAQDRIVVVQDGVTRQVPFLDFQESFMMKRGTPPTASSDAGVASEMSFDANNAYLYTGSAWLRIPFGGNKTDWTIAASNSTKPAQGGAVALSDLDTDTSVVFDDAFPSSGGSPVVTVSLANTVDVSPSDISAVITAVSLTGFTVEYSTAIDTDNWQLYWQAVQY